MVKEIIIPKENKAQVEEVREIENKELEQKKDEKVAESYEAEFDVIDTNPDFGPGQSQSSDEKTEKIGEGIIGGALAIGSVFPPTAPVVAPTAAIMGIGGEVVDLVTSDNASPNSDEGAAKRVGKGLKLSGAIGSAPTAVHKVVTGEAAKDAKDLAETVSNS
jgi:hypothetical protein